MFPQSLLLLLVIACVCVMAHRPTGHSNRASRAKSRSVSRKSAQQDQQTCLLKEIDACLDRIQVLVKGPSHSSIITSVKGLDKLCSTVTDVLRCVKGYLKKCATPLQHEVYKLSIYYFSATLRKFSDKGTEKKS